MSPQAIVLALALLLSFDHFCDGAHLVETFPNLQQKMSKESRIEENVIPSPAFGQKLYEADYTTNHELKVKQIVQLYYADSSNTTVERNGYNDFFNVSFGDSTHNEICIELLKPLPEKILSQQKSIRLTIRAELKDDPKQFDNCTFRINILTEPAASTPENEITSTTVAEENSIQGPSYDRTVYEADYTNDHTFQMRQIIQLHYADPTNTTVNIIGYNDFFSVDFAASKNEEISIELIKPLTENIILTQRSIQIKLRAELKMNKSKFDECTVHISIARPVTEPPENKTTMDYEKGFYTTKPPQKTTSTVSESKTTTTNHQLVDEKLYKIFLYSNDDTYYGTLVAILFIIQFLFGIVIIILVGLYIKLHFFVTKRCSL